MDDQAHSDAQSLDFCDAVICFSHLRWTSVFQRPQHLMRRFARRLPVFFFEEAFCDAPSDGPRLDSRMEDGVHVAVPHVPPEPTSAMYIHAQRVLLDCMIARHEIRRPLLWYFTPMSLSFSDHLAAVAIVYDCMDDLTGFRNAPPHLGQLDARLLSRTDLVFAGGRSLHEVKKKVHDNVHLFPSSVDVHHFKTARHSLQDPDDQSAIPHPRLGYCGVIDERMDLDLLRELSAAHPDWHIVMLGPVLKLNPERLPDVPNLHYLGAKTYAEVPRYLSGWDVALIPFALNAATRFVSPTKTPEYLAAGLPVVSTPIADVVHDYGDRGLVAIAADARGFAAAIEKILGCVDRNDWHRKVDTMLVRTSWDATWQAMVEQISLLARKPDPASVPTRSAHSSTYPSAHPLVRLTPLSTHLFDFLIVGAGFAGSVLAERLASGSDKRVLVVDRRAHVGGNASDAYDDAGILVHRYGPHIFHTNSDAVWNYLSAFTAWRPYEHRVLAHVAGKMVPIPINLNTINQLYELQLTSAEMETFLADRAEIPEVIRTSRDVVMATVGKDLYEKFFEGYTRKQWGVDSSRLDKSVTSRIPTRTNTDDRYFTDKHQAMPQFGYTRLFENMLEHPNIKVMLNTDYREIVRRIPHAAMIYTGPIDEYFDHRFGPLPYRSLRFRHITLDRPHFQPCAVVNYPAPEVPYTRITEYKQLTGQAHEKTSISVEYPCSDGDPYYPIPNAENAALFRKYQALADNTPDVWFVGRLATYRYYNMDQVVAQALTLYQRLTEPGGSLRLGGSDRTIRA